MKTAVFLVFLHFCNSAKLPPTFKKCDPKKDNLNQCLSTAIKEAVAELIEPKEEIGLPNLEPLDIPSMVIGAGNGAVQFDQNYKNVKMYGSTKIASMEATFNLEDKILKLNFTTPQIKLDFNYEISGKMLLLPIKGDGPGSITLTEPTFVLTFYLDDVIKKNKKYFKVVKNTLSIEPKNIHFRLDNLFNGDKALGDNINQVMNDNWNEVFSDVKPSYEDLFGKIFSTIFDNFLRKVPVSEMFASD